MAISVSKTRFNESRLRTTPFWACDFLTQTAGQFSPFTSVAVASGTLAAPNSTNANHPGIVRVRSSTTTNSGYLIGSNSAQLMLGGNEEFNAIFSLDTLALSTFRLGFQNSTTDADAADGCYIEVNSSGVATGKTATNSTRSSTGTTTTLSTSTWYRAKILVAPSASRVDFYIFNDAGTQIWTDGLTTNIPTARSTGGAITATNSGTTALDLYHLDYLSVKFGPLNRGGF